MSFTKRDRVNNASAGLGTVLEELDSNHVVVAFDSGRVESLPSSALALDVPPAPREGPRTGVSGLLVDLEVLMVRSTTGSAWDWLVKWAAQAERIAPVLGNFDDNADSGRAASKYLACAMVAARTGSDRHRRVVVRGLDALIGTENRSTDGTPSASYLLATGRQLPGWLAAADLIGYDNPSFDMWLRTLPTKTIGDHGRVQWRALVGCSHNSASNWGLACLSSWAAIAIYLGDTAQLAEVSARFRYFLGDLSQYVAPYGKTSDWDRTWFVDPVRWTGVNRSTERLLDGAVGEDASRSAGSFPTLDRSGVGYTLETFSSMVLLAVMLDQAGRPDVWGWSEAAIRRTADWLVRYSAPYNSLRGVGSTNGWYAISKWMAWALNHYYGARYPTEPSVYARNTVGADWIYA
jgi:hypothetical protein